MAAGDSFAFDQMMLDVGAKRHDLSSDALTIALITDAFTPAINTPDPRWGAGGGTDLSVNQVPVGGTYTGPIALSGIAWALVGGLAKLSANNVTIPQHASGFSNARWGVIYNNTDAGKRALSFIDLGSLRSIITGPLAINWNAGGIANFVRV